MSNPKPTADDYRDRLVDRVLAEALGDERPPDLSPMIAQRVADAQAEVASTVQGRGVMRSRRVWITLLATAASLMGVVLWHNVSNQKVGGVGEVAILDTSRLSEDEGSQVESKQFGKQLFANAAADNRLEDKSGGAAVEPRSTGRFAIVDDVLGGRRELLPQPTDSSDAVTLQIVAEPAIEVPASQSPQQLGQRDQVHWEMQANVDRTASGAESAFPEPQRRRATVGVNAPIVSDLEASSSPSTPSAKTAPLVALRESSSGTFIGSAATQDGASGAPSASPATNLPSPYYLSDDVQYYAPGPEYDNARSAKDWSALKSRRSLSASRDRYEPIHENAFVKPVGEDALSTFSIDVDTASYANVRQYLRDMRQMPPADAVRIEELVNYFDYGYEAPKAPSKETEREEPFAANLGCFACPWKPEHKLVRIGVKGREVAVDKRPLSNLVFLVDVSGSMNEWNKLPLVISGLKALSNKLGENDRVAIVVYAGSEGLVLPGTSGDQKDAIRAALDRLTAGGSTAGGAGLRLAYEIAERNKIVGGVNRVVLCTDGDFNVGMTGTEEIAQFVETRAKETNVYLTVLGFGRGNLNDAMLEQISGRGDGNYAYIDDFKEAHRVLSSDLSKTLVAIAKDVKMQVEFNPKKVASYRLIGYENRVMAAEDFNNDAKDAGDIGAGHTVTALYEVVPVGVEEPAPAVDGLKYQADAAAVEDDAAHVELTADIEEPTAFADELLTLKIRYKQPEGGASKKIEFPLEDSDSGKSVADADTDFRWAAAVAEFGMLLRNSRHVGDGSFDAVLELARGAIGDDPQGYRAEFVDLVRRAKEVSGR
jgi:Ca-activated chloride channel family protein